MDIGERRKRYQRTLKRHRRFWFYECHGHDDDDRVYKVFVVSVTHITTFLIWEVFYHREG